MSQLQREFAATFDNFSVNLTKQICIKKLLTKNNKPQL